MKDSQLQWFTCFSIKNLKLVVSNLCQIVNELCEEFINAY